MQRDHIEMDNYTEDSFYGNPTHDAVTCSRENITEGPNAGLLDKEQIQMYTHTHTHTHTHIISVQYSSVAQSCPTLCDPMDCSTPPCISTSGACSNSLPLSHWCHPTISSSVIPFSSCPQSFPASGSFPVSQLIPSGGQSVGASASSSVLPMNIQGWFPLEESLFTVYISNMGESSFGSICVFV